MGLTLEERLIKSYELGSDARVLASPVLHEGSLYALQEDATLNVIENAGFAGCGDDAGAAGGVRARAPR